MSPRFRIAIMQSLSRINFQSTKLFCHGTLCLKWMGRLILLRKEVSMNLEEQLDRLQLVTPYQRDCTKRYFPLLTYVTCTGVTIRAQQHPLLVTGRMNTYGG